MQRNQELVDFEVDPATGAARVIDASEAGDDLLACVRPISLNLEPIRLSPDKALTVLMAKRAISPLRDDQDDVIAAFGAKSAVDLALRGHGLSLSDQFWYRAPGGTERWEDINFFDNGWDPGFGAAVLKRDYVALASCSCETPDATTCGRTIKMWERGSDGIFLIKESIHPDGTDLVGAKLASDMCARLFDEGCYVPLEIVERHGCTCSATPLMLAGDEELADGGRLRAMAGMRDEPGKGDGSRISTERLQSLIEAYEAVGVAGASAHVARMACCFSLAFVSDFHSGNLGVIRRVGADAWRAAPIFDLEGSFGLLRSEETRRLVIAHPFVAKLQCASSFSFLDPSWDWSWYDPQALDGFEERIVEVLASCQNTSREFVELAAQLFAMQRAYVNSIASAQAQCPECESSDAR